MLIIFIKTRWWMSRIIIKRKNGIIPQIKIILTIYQSQTGKWNKLMWQQLQATYKE